MIIQFIAYYLIGIPLLYFFSIYLDLKIIGIWINYIIISLILVCAYYTIRKNIKLDKSLDIISLRNKKIQD